MISSSSMLPVFTSSSSSPTSGLPPLSTIICVWPVCPV